VRREVYGVVNENEHVGWIGVGDVLVTLGCEEFSRLESVWTSWN
jgi:hypothetical protein